MRVLLGVAGGIAAFKAAALASALVQRGHRVDVIMTADAHRFVGPLTFAALTRNPVLTSLWDDAAAIPHIALVRAADVYAIVPATANVLAKIAAGIADDLLTNAALAATIPLVVAPAMNAAMFENPATTRNLECLAERGVRIVAPGVGFLAEREHGVGRLAEPEEILAAIEAVAERPQDLAGRRVFVNAGPTREAIDPVRFLSNASTGTMGVAIALEARARGASVDLVLGPTALPDPPDVAVTRVTSAAEMYEASLARALGADVAVATAAVADWRPALRYDRKVKKHEGPESIALERTPDILAALGERKGGRTFLVGFAAETENLEVQAREKLVRKRLDAIAVNDVSRSGRGFGSGPSELSLLHGAEGRVALGRGSKSWLARGFWDAVLDLARAKAAACS